MSPRSPTSSASPRHVLLSHSEGAHGFQYGMLRDFEDEIVRITGASVVAAPQYPAPAPVRGRIAHGTRFAPLRRFAPKSGDFSVRGDVLWAVMMGAEASSLDLFRAWDRHVGFRIAYVIDTYPEQMSAVVSLAKACPWDLLITAMHGAVPLLERETGKRWHAVALGVKPSRFPEIRAADRVIGVSSYGRRLESVHREIERASVDRGFHYDVTVASSLDRRVPVDYLYRQYAWHVGHSVFTVTWPVEQTHPGRAGGLSPLTCRWFEAGASGTVMIGAPPKDPRYEAMFGERAMLPLDPSARPEELRATLARYWDERETHLARASALRAEKLGGWTWEARVREILALAGLDRS